MRRKTEQDYHDFAKARNLKWIGANVVRVQEKTEWECQFGHQWAMTHDSIQQGSGCPHCSGRVRKTPEDYHKLAEKRGFYWVGSQVISTHTKTDWKCSGGHQWRATYHNIGMGRRCPYCSGKARKTAKDYHNLAQERGFVWEGQFPAAAHIKTGWKCQQGHYWQASFMTIRVNGCPHCSRKVKKTPDDYHSLAKKRIFTWEGPEVSNVDSRTGWKCHRGHQWITTFNSIQSGTGCPFCKKSQGENSVIQFLEKSSIQYEREKRFPECKDIYTLPFDFYFCIGQSVILIEYDGIQHFKPMPRWGGQEALAKVQYHDRIKTAFAQQQGFILIRIPYTEEDIEGFLSRELNALS